MKHAFSILAAIAFLAVSAAAQPVAEIGSDEYCSGYNATFTGVTPVAGGYYNWSYKICQAGPNDISHWVLESCVCGDYGNVDDCMQAGVLQSYGSTLEGMHFSYETPDPYTNVIGFKFDELDWPTMPMCADFWFVVNISTPEEKDFGLKPDNKFCDSINHYGPILGPAHEDTTTTTTSTTTTTEISTTTTTTISTTTTVPNAPEFASVSAVLAVLLSAPAFAFLAVKRKE